MTGPSLNAMKNQIKQVGKKLLSLVKKEQTEKDATNYLIQRDDPLRKPMFIVKRNSYEKL